MSTMSEKAAPNRTDDQVLDLEEIPPPSYTKATKPDPSANIPVLDSGDNAQATLFPPQPHHTQAICRTMHFMYSKWGTNCVKILDNDQATELYTMTLRMRKPNVTIESASTHATIGTVGYHMLKASIDSTVHGHQIPLTAHGVLCARYTWPSPSLGGAGMTWNIKKSNMNLECLDEGGIPIARFRFSCWSLKKAGKLEFLGPKGNGESVMEEILVTGLALVECILATRYAAAT